MGTGYVVGYVLVQFMCFGSQTNCEVQQVEPGTFSTKSECNWVRESKAPYYPLSTTECAEVFRPQNNFGERP